MSKADNTRMIKETARELGFSFCGIARADYLEDQAPLLENWLRQGRQGEMSYLERNFDKRLDPRKLFPGARSVISLLHNYYTDREAADPEAPRISIYAYGRDYHKVLRKKLKKLLALIRDEIGEVEGRGFVDSAPILERAWAARSGLGWIGKNCSLINRAQGSYFFLAELVVDLELDYDQPVADFCAKCRLCVDACPTGALFEPYQLDANLCISYLTIEYDGKLPVELSPRFGNWVFGCDICQRVCPFNRRSRPHEEPQFLPDPRLLALSRKDWRELNESLYERLFTGSAVNRAGFGNLRRNLEFLDYWK